ncbi:Clp protease N-terminal domain-containing protein, partial [Roseiflexus castenholzii]|uniref:Clp protease N-terminal domain-containing protein n=1 Tax=Roseiflexus castenholzii TaxID=120962 RepID=UPI003C7BD70E
MPAKNTQHAKGQTVAVAIEPLWTAFPPEKIYARAHGCILCTKAEDLRHSQAAMDLASSILTGILYPGAMMRSMPHKNRIVNHAVMKCLRRFPFWNEAVEKTKKNPHLAALIAGIIWDEIISIDSVKNLILQQESIGDALTPSIIRDVSRHLYLVIESILDERQNERQSQQAPVSANLDSAFQSALASAFQGAGIHPADLASALQRAGILPADLASALQHAGVHPADLALALQHANVHPSEDPSAPPEGMDLTGLSDALRQAGIDVSALIAAIQQASLASALRRAGVNPEALRFVLHQAGINPSHVFDRLQGRGVDPINLLDGLAEPFHDLLQTRFPTLVSLSQSGFDLQQLADALRDAATPQEAVRHALEAHGIDP